MLLTICISTPPVQAPHAKHLHFKHLCAQRIGNDYNSKSCLGVVQSMTASAYVFCAALQNALPAATHTTSIAFPLVQDTRPITADWPALADTNGTWVYFDAQIQ